MIRTSSSYSLLPQINDCVNVTIPQVDRPRKLSIENIVGVIISIEEHGHHKLYNVGTLYGCIRPLLSRNQFELSSQRNMLDPSTVDRKRQTNIRQIAALTTAAADQGPSTSSSVFCYCATDFCRTRRCICRRNGKKCTDRCKHGRNNRTGRIDKEIAVKFKCNNKK